MIPECSPSTLTVNISCLDSIRPHHIVMFFNSLDLSLSEDKGDVNKEDAKVNSSSIRCRLELSGPWSRVVAGPKKSAILETMSSP